MFDRADSEKNKFSGMVLFCPIYPKPHKLKVKKMPKDIPMVSLTQLLTHSTPLQGLIQRGQALQQLEQRLKLHLPEGLQTHCCVANITADRLIFLTDSAVWATQLRYWRDVLLKHTQDITGQNIVHLEIRVRPAHFVENTAKENTHPAPQRSLSPETSALLRSVADSMADTSLQSVLYRLAQAADHDTETGCK